jgi:hypothetical protein
MGLPPIGCNTLGKEDFILVPLPAAKTTTEKVIQFPLKSEVSVAHAYRIFDILLI